MWTKWTLVDLGGQSKSTYVHLSPLRPHLSMSLHCSLRVGSAFSVALRLTYRKLNNGKSSTLDKEIQFR